MQGVASMALLRIHLQTVSHSGGRAYALESFGLARSMGGFCRLALSASGFHVMAVAS